MKKNKRLLIFCCAALLLLAGAALLRFGRASKIEYGKNLLLNGDFEALDGENSFEHWYPNAYVLSPGVTSYLEGVGRTGRGAQIKNHGANDARFMQSVRVEPSTLYCLEGDILSDAEGGRGANLSVAGVYAFSENVYRSDGWRHVRLYGRTGASQREVTVYARLGGYSGESQGTATFDNIALYAVETVPAGETEYLWEENVGLPEVPAEDAPARSAWPILALVALLYLMCALALMRAAARGAGDGGAAAVIVLLAAALAVRVAVALSVPGYQVDIGCFTAWSNRMAEVGPSAFYLTDMHADYPPGYMLVLWPLGILGRWLGSGATEWMVKMPPIFCDLLAVWLLYARRPKGQGLWSFLPALLYALNPLTVLTGAAWGQADSVTALLAVLTVLYAVQGDWVRALPLYMLAVLVKPQALMFGPLGLLALAMDMVWNKAEGKPRRVLQGIGLAVAVLVAVCLPFSVKQQGFDWLIKLYSGTMTYYDKATVNMTNLYFLFGLNWGSLDTEAPLMMRLLGVMTALAPLTGYAYLLRRRQGLKGALRLSLVLVAMVLLLIVFVPLSLKILGPVLMAVCFAMVALQFVQGRDMRLLPLYGAVVLIVFSTLGVMMHERYMFPALLLLFTAFALVRDVRILYLALVMTVPVFLNVGLVLDRAARIGGVEGHLFAPGFGIASDTAWLEMALSVMHLVTAAAALCVGFLLSDQRTRAAALPKFEANENTGWIHAFETPLPLLRTARKDALIILAVTLAYAFAAFFNLGSTRAPQRAWVSRAEDELIQFDLGSARSFRVLYYPGIHWDNKTFTLLAGDDLENLTPYTADVDPGDCFAWRWQKTGGAIDVLTGRYAALRADSIGLMLFEIIFQDAETGETIAAKLTGGQAADMRPEDVLSSAQALCDEQDAMRNEPLLFGADKTAAMADGLPAGALRPSWYNSMYFDEIYHARTGYEQLNALKGQEPSAIYETTHPPLGKVLMTLCISLFGMTPFGWRFAGAAAGVLMLPPMYLFGRLLTRRRWPGLLTMVLMAADAMHFTQTRIATIDSFGTLFIIWATYFMCRYVLMDYYAVPLRKTLVPLGLSGLFMGLAIASKWTGMYAGAGLAVMFFVSLYRRVRQGVAARRMLMSGEKAQGFTDYMQLAAEQWDQRALRTLLWCLVFFIAVPALIYYLSFYPVFVATHRGLTVQKVIQSSIGMLNYHAEPGRGMDHPYYSPWYLWPIIQKPMWYYSSAKLWNCGSTIFAFGNPAVWWMGLAALVALLLETVVRKAQAKIRHTEGRYDVPALLVLVGFAAQYLPWALVPRGTYIYHYFPSVPFLILAGALLAGRLLNRRPKAGRAAAIAWMALAVILFIGFYPYASGLRVPFGWLDSMRWLPGIWY